MVHVPRVKFCGTNSVSSREIAEKLGADYFGVVVDVPRSPRSVTVARAREIFPA